jgi:phosphoserine phosphatase
VRDRARALGVDLAASYAYGDSLSDLPMLEEVGTPVAVNPDSALRALARKRGWAIEDWPAEAALARFRVPPSVGA